jgi:hypothetical protein
MALRNVFLFWFFVAVVSCYLSSDQNASFFQVVCPESNGGCDNSSGACTVHELNVNACLPLADSKQTVLVVACYPQKFHHVAPHIVVRTFSESNCTGAFEETNQQVGECFEYRSLYVMNECSVGQPVNSIRAAMAKEATPFFAQT